MEILFHLGFVHVQYYDRANSLSSALKVKSPREEECFNPGDVSKLGHKD